MADNLSEIVCSHCGAKNSIGETIEVYFCSECEWWGHEPDKLIYDPESFKDNDFRQGQVPRRPAD